MDFLRGSVDIDVNVQQIMFHSIEKEYLLTNLPWLIGSLGTMAEDAIIFVQFHMFKNNASTEAVQ